MYRSTFNIITGVNIAVYVVNVAGPCLQDLVALPGGKMWIKDEFEGKLMIVGEKYWAWEKPEVKV